MTKPQFNQSNTLPGIAHKFIARKLISKQTAQFINTAAVQQGCSFYQQLLEQGNVAAATACELAAEEFGLPMLELSAVNLELIPLNLVPSSLLEKHLVLPLSIRGSRLLVAIGDPGQREALDEVRFKTNLELVPVLVDHAKLVDTIDSIFIEDAGLSLDEIVEEVDLEDLDLGAESNGGEQLTTEAKLDTPIVRFVNKVLQDAISRDVSDIHIEPYETTTRIRYRVDGVLYDVLSPPQGLIHKIISRLKVLSHLDIAERRIPQDGRMKLRFSRSKTVDFRISTMPTLFGEKMVIRVLDTGAADLALDTIGMEAAQLDLYRKASLQPQGMILVTGPTGSGKTVSLYSAINLLNVPERNISSVEDPVEIYVNGVNQVNINEKAGLTFSRILRAFLRQDPDVLMIGEIRDLETAEIAIKAAQTGHLVLSTLHTNDASSSLTRLVNMGVAPFNIASSVNLILAQRLVRRLCDGCRKTVKLPDEALLRAGFSENTLDSLQLYEAVGCGGCSAGYRGRTGIFEVMPVSEKIAELLMSNATPQEIEHQARAEGVKSMRQSGLDKVARGMTTLAEIERVTID